VQRLGLLFAQQPRHISLPRKGCRVGLHIDLFEDCSAFTRVAACTLALSPVRDTLPEGFSHFVTSMTAPVASGWSDRRVGLAPTGKRRLTTAHTHSHHSTGPSANGWIRPLTAVHLHLSDARFPRLLVDPNKPIFRVW